MKKVLLTGHRKSGTSLLGKLFNGYAESNVLVYPTDLTVLYGGYDPFFYSKGKKEFRNGFFRIVHETMEPYDGIRLAPNQPLFSFSFFCEALRADEQVLDSIRSRRDLVDLVSKAFAKTLNFESPNEFIFKETSQLVHAEDLLGPTDKAVVIFRDPRDVFSAIKDGFAPYYSANGEGFHQSLQSVLFRYRVDYQSFLAFSKANIGAIKAIRFEDLVQDPELVMRGVCDFLGIPFSQSLLVPMDGEHAYRGNTYGALEIPIGKVTAKNVGGWKDRLSEDESQIIEFFLGDLFEALDYEKSADTASRSRAVSEHYRVINSGFFFKNPKLEGFFDA